MTEGRGVSIPYVAIGAVVLWLAAVGLMAWDTILGDGDGIFGRWALLTSAAAASWTIIASLCVTRRATADAVARKVALLQETDRLSRI